MSDNFRFESVSDNGMSKGPYTYIKVFAKSDEHMPLKFDSTDNRFGIITDYSEKFMDRIHNFEVRKDDVWIITMPKSGTTWMVELVWLLSNNLDYKAACEVGQSLRCPYLDLCIARRPINEVNSIDVTENAKSPRLIKSHLPIHLLPKALWTVKPKIIYVAREPKDVSLSYYYFLSALGLITYTKENFLKDFLNDEALYCPFWPHVLEFWRLRNESFIHFTSYEQMIKDLKTVVHQIGNFLQKPINENDMEKLLDHLSFEKMKNNPSCNHVKGINKVQNTHGVQKSQYSFYRKGIAESYKDDLSTDAIDRFTKWTQRYLDPHGLTIDEILFT